MLRLEWRPTPRRLTLQWMGGGVATSVAAQPSNPAQVAVIIGPPGKDGTIPTAVVTAGIALSGHRAVYVADDGNAYPCQPDLTARQCVGITTGAAAQGGDAVVQTGNLMTEPSWSWMPGIPVWIGADGLLTQVAPIAGALCQIGTPVGPTTLRINVQFYALL